MRKPETMSPATNVPNRHYLKVKHSNAFSYVIKVDALHSSFLSLSPSLKKNTKVPSVLLEDIDVSQLKHQALTGMTAFGSCHLFPALVTV